MTMGAAEQIQAMKKRGMSSYAIARALNAQGVPTTSGTGQWHPHQVNRVADVQARAEWNSYMRAYRARKKHGQG